jgi:hypothetical protein
MFSKKVKFYLLIALVALTAYVIYDSTSQPGIQDLTTDFQEVSSYRNENNTGPIIRIYAVTSSDIEAQDEMRKYGDFMPHTKYGTTKVYFFQEGDAVPANLVPGAKNFDDHFLPNVIAYYEKDANGQVIFKTF